MCVIIYKPAGVHFPSDEVMSKCFRANPDGAGYMYPLLDKGKVRIHKGFMSLKDFLEDIDRHRSRYDLPFILHFRIGTQGKNNAQMTHPFPVIDNDEALESLNSVCDVGLAHNGIINLTSSWNTYTNSSAKEEKSDTFYFVRDYATLIANNPDWHKVENHQSLLAKLADSKLSIMSSDGTVINIGGDFYEVKDEEAEGCLFSNLQWNTAIVRSYGSYGRSSLGDAYGSCVDYDDWESYRDECVRWSSIPYEVEPMGEGKKWDTTSKIAAAWVPEEYFILNESDGTMVQPLSDSWVYDQRGNVYLYDDEWNGLVPCEDFSVVDNELDYAGATKGECVMFTVFENIDGNQRIINMDEKDIKEVAN